MRKRAAPLIMRSKASCARSSGMVWIIARTPVCTLKRIVSSESAATPDGQALIDVRRPIIAAVSDKETGLLPAIAAVLPGVRHQLCQFHFLKNCASVMDGDLQTLGTSVDERAERVQKIAKRLHEKGFDSIESEHNLAANPAPASPKGKSRYATEKDELSEEQLASELCAMARHASRRSGRAPLNPPALVRHNELERVGATVQRAKKKKTATTRS